MTGPSPTGQPGSVGGDRATTARPPAARGFTLLELILAVALLSFATLLLAQILSETATSWSQGQREADIFGETRAAVEFMRKELGGAFVSRPAQVAPIEAGDSLSLLQRELFEGRVLMPFEVNRTVGSSDWGQEASFVNAEPGFGSLAFVQSAPLARHAHSLYDRASEEVVEAWLEEVGLADHRRYDLDTISLAAASLTGYYVAYTHDSPLPESGRSLKLYRHFRRSGGGPSSGQGRSRGFLIYLSDVINEVYDEVPERSYPLDPPVALVRRGIFSNSDIPYLFGAYVPDISTFEPGDGMESSGLMQPWPSNPIMGGDAPELPVPPMPFPPPDRSDPEAWRQVEDASHNYIYPDEPLAQNVVRFECEAYRWVEGGSGSILVGAQQMNSLLGFPPDDGWPVLVAPDFVEITIGVISDEAAAKLFLKDDWLFDWEDNNRSNWDWRRNLVERDMRTFLIRAHVRRSH